MTAAEIEARLLRGKVLVELGWLVEAEREVTAVLAAAPDHLDALGLYAKIEHLGGRLSHALALWARIHAGSPHDEPVLVQLHALLGIAHERGHGVAIGHHPLARKPPAQRELEQALALFRDQRPDEARARCAMLASRYRGRDPQLFKVAALAGAWLAELVGDTAAARAQLEQLGLERGFEHDLDRLFALARVYEQLDQADTLAAAAKIYRHIARELEANGGEKISLYSRLAALERRAGRVDAAAQLDEQFLAGMQRRMFRPSLHDVVRVAATTYLPIRHLRELRTAGDRLPPEPTARERALVHALRGEHAAARALLVDGGSGLDRWYLAELAALDGDDERAIEQFLATLATLDDEPGVEHVIGWLLDRHAEHPSPAIAAYAADPARRAHAFAVIERARDLAPQRPAPWRWLATLHAVAGDHAHAARHAARAEAVAAVAATREAPIGRVLAASVYHFVGRAKGLLHELSVHRAPTAPGRGGMLVADDIHGNVTPELRASIRNTFVAVRDYARAKFPHATSDLDDYTYSVKLPKEDEPSGGLSAGLPCALAMLSMFLQRPVSRAIASSGALIAEAHDVLSIGRIGEADYKVKAAYHGNLKSLLLPLANRSDLDRSVLVPRAITDEVVRYAADFDDAVKLVFGADVFTRL